ncbi:MAG TPA: biopolymer transporter ExbD [Anaeromyxobacteraceae bacterium]|jgi:biopolymer transport protein ExbD|nr:biopolymer transporter ExbD [Anaeromyxobacteraceae bacterium]
MGAAAMPEGGRGRRRRPLDAVINVVPAIDLLSCCIAFLLFTAVWSQVSRLEVQPLGAPAEAAETRGTVPLTVALTAQGYRLAVGDEKPFEIPAGREAGQARYDLKALDARLRALKARYPAQTSVTISAEDAVVYRDVIDVIDACVGAGLPGVAVASAG